MHTLRNVIWAIRGLIGFYNLITFAESIFFKLFFKTSIYKLNRVFRNEEKVTLQLVVNITDDTPLSDIRFSVQVFV